MAKARGYIDNIYESEETPMALKLHFIGYKEWLNDKNLSESKVKFMFDNKCLKDSCMRKKICYVMGMAQPDDKIIVICE